MTVAILFGALFLCLLLRAPIAIALGMASLTAIHYSGAVSLRYIATSMTTALDNFPLMGVPFFVLAGELMSTGGISKRLLDVANAFLGRVTGGTAVVTVVACMFFAAISGSGPATVAAVGCMMVPEMIRQGYDKNFACGLIAASGTIGVIIPPSVPMIIYAVSTSSVSISDMFMAGVFPGLLVGGALILWAYVYSRHKGYKGDATYYSLSWSDKMKMVWAAKWALLVPVIILGGIYGGVFTPTEAAAVAVGYGFVVGKFVYKDLVWGDILPTISRSALTGATIMIIIGCATGFGRILAIHRVPETLAHSISAYSHSTFLVMSLTMLLLLIVGCFMEALAAIIILAPILLPVAKMVGVDPVHFGIAMVVNLAIGYITPPLGVNLFVTCSIANMSVDELSKSILPWLAVLLLALGLIVAFPQISMFLPQFFNALRG